MTRIAAETLDDFKFQVNDTAQTRTQKLELLRQTTSRQGIKIASRDLRFNLSERLQDAGPLFPDDLPLLDIGQIIQIPGEGDVFSYDGQGETIVGTRDWLPIGVDRNFRAGFRARIAQDSTSAVASAYTVFLIYDPAGRYIGNHKFQLQDGAWTAADGWRDFAPETNSADIKAEFPTAAYIRSGFQFSNPGNARMALLSPRNEDITGIAGAEYWAILAEASADSAAIADANTAAALALAQAAVTTANTAAINALNSAIGAAGSATTAAGHATVASAQASEATGQAAASLASAVAAQSYRDAAGVSATASNVSAQAAATSATTAGAHASAADVSRLQAQTSADNSATSATASNESANTAAAASTSAGNFAAAANTSKIAAEAANVSANASATLAAAEAVTASAAQAAATAQATLSATYRDQSLAYSNDALGYRDTAIAQATISSAQAAIATAQAAAASASAVLSAKLASPAEIKNSTFADWPGAASDLPTDWVLWAALYTRIRTTGLVSQNGVLFNTNGSAGIQQTIDGTRFVPDSWHVLRAVVTLDFGSFVDAQPDLLIWAGFNAGQLSLTTDPDNTGNAVGAGVAGRTYTWSKLIQCPVGVTTASLILRAYNGSGATIQAVWHEAGIRPATPAEIRDQTVLAPMEATVATHATAIATNASQIASLTTTVTAQGASITTQATAISTLQTKTSSYLQRVTAGAGTATIEMIANDINGIVATTISIIAHVVLLGAGRQPVLKVEADKATFGEDVYVNNAKLIVNSGTHMKVIGNGFGTSNQFVEWYGPVMAFNLCSEANAITYLKTNGNAYFGGTLSAGVLKNAAQATGLTTGEIIEVGPFGTNGNPIAVVVSWSYMVTQNLTYPNTTPGRDAFLADAAAAGATNDGTGYYSGNANETVASSSLSLDRAIGAGAYANVASNSTTSRQVSFAGQIPVVGGDDGNAERIYTGTISFTYTDNAGGTQNRKFKATLNRGYTIGVGTAAQSVGIVATEG